MTVAIWDLGYTEGRIPKALFRLFKKLTYGSLGKMVVVAVTKRRKE